jgi:sortase A
MIGVGVLLLLFVAYQLWGTSIRTARAQSDLDAEFERRLTEAAAVTTPTAPTPRDPVVPASSTPVPAPALPAELMPTPGDAAGRIVIPRIGVDYVFVEGVSVDDLKRGPGHYPATPLPGQAGNAAIAGHRTTYGAPFGRVDELAPGDEIVVTTIQGEFTYEVRETQIVSPSQVEVLEADHWGWPNALTLTACHPRYSARQRIIIGAELVRAPAPAPAPARQPQAPSPPVPAPTPEPTPQPELDVPAERGPALVRGTGVLALWLLVWAAARRWRRWRWPIYAVGTVPVLVLLFLFFEAFSELLPASY